VKMFLLFL